MKKKETKAEVNHNSREDVWELVKEWDNIVVDKDGKELDTRLANVGQMEPPKLILED